MTWNLVASPSVWLTRFLLTCKLAPELMILQIPSRQTGQSKPGVAQRLWRNYLRFQATVLSRTTGFLLRKVSQVHITSDINLDLDALELLKRSSSDVCIVRGGRVLKRELLNSFRGQWINIHGGVLPDYRGLDSHLWAAFNQDWGSIGVSAHILTEALDKGPIICTFRLHNARNKGWIPLTLAIRNLENKVHRKLLFDFPKLDMLGSDSGRAGAYYGKYPRFLGLIPFLRR